MQHAISDDWVLVTNDTTDFVTLVGREEMHPGLVCLNFADGHNTLDSQKRLFRHALKLLADLDPVLKRANLAITATRKYKSLEEATRAYETWQRSLEKSLDESLGELSNRLVEALTEDDRFHEESVSELNAKLRKVADWRNALCHGAWTDYDEKSRKATLRHWPRKGWREQSEQPISQADLAAIGEDAVDLTCRVIEAATANGIQFPGSEGPGEPAWPSQPEKP